MSVSFCLPHPVAVSVLLFVVAYVLVLRMYMLYVSFGSKVGPRTFGCVAMGSAVLFYFEVQIALIFCRVWSEQSASCFVWI